MKKLKKMPQLRGQIPMVYNRESIFNMCAVINALANAIDYLNEEVERLKKEREENA